MSPRSRSRPDPRLAASRSTCGSTRSSPPAGSPTPRWDATSSASDPTDPAGTNDEAAAAKDESGKPVSNAARNLWVTETALSTALNVSYLASGVAIFSIVVGIALILAGFGFLLLAAAVFRKESPEGKRA